MGKQIFCEKLKKEAESLDDLPFPGKIGEKIFAQISREAWELWLGHQTMLINEYRLSLIDPKARSFLQEEMQKYFFGPGSKLPSGFVLKNSSSDNT